MRRRVQWLFVAAAAAVVLFGLGSAEASAQNGGDSITSPDTVGDVGQYTSLVLDAAGFPVIAYYDLTNGDLKILHCGDATCSAGNTITSPDTAGDVGHYASLQLGAAGFPVVAYYDVTNGDLKILRCGDATCSAGNTITSPDTVDDVGQHVSLALDASGFPVVAYHNATKNDLKVLHCGDATCSAGNTITTPDRIDAGRYTSLVLDPSGLPIVTYIRGSGDLWFLHCGDAACANGNTRQNRVRGAVPAATSVLLDDNERPVVVSSVVSSGGGAFLSLDGCFDLSCASFWYAAILAPGTAPQSSLALNGDTKVVAHGVSGNLRVATMCFPGCGFSNKTLHHPDREGETGFYPSLALDSSGFPIVSYYDETNGDLKVLHCDDLLCAPSPDVTGPAVTITTPLDGAVVGQGSVVLAEYECDDEVGGSGLVSCIGDVAAGDAIDTANPGDKTFTVTGVDEAGNETVVVHNYSVTSTLVLVTAPADGQVVEQNEVVLADYLCDSSPGGPAIVSCVGDVADGAAIDTASLGTTTFTVTAVNAEAVETVVVHAYTVGRSDVSCDPDLVTIDMTVNGGDGTGTPGDDVIWGTPGNDLIRGFGGDDILCGGDGVDRIRGGSGVDVLVGDGGRDRLDGQGGSDIMFGGDGSDRIRGQGGADTASGGPGRDSVSGQSGSDILRGGGGDDTIEGSIGADTIRGDGGDDLLRGGRGNDVLYGGVGLDHCAGNLGVDDQAEAATCEQTPGVESLF